MRHRQHKIPPYVWGWLGVLAFMLAIILFFETVE